MTLEELVGLLVDCGYSPSDLYAVTSKEKLVIYRGNSKGEGVKTINGDFVELCKLRRELNDFCRASRLILPPSR